MPHRLSRRALNISLYGRHSAAGGSRLRERAQQLAVIAAAYSRSELIGEYGVGEIIVSEIERWLKMQGLDFRTENTSNSCEFRHYSSSSDQDL